MSTALMKEEKREKVLSVDKLAISFRTGSDKLQAVRGVSFDLYRGETLAIVGESGSGKSACARAIMGLLTKNAVIEGGTIKYNGENLLRLPEKKLQRIRGRKIALVFQDPLSALNPLMMVGRQISEVLRMDGVLTRKEAEEKTLELLAAVGIDNPKERAKQYPFQFSGGMRQRIVIAIALARDPEILICDEPTTALDVTVQARILDLINLLKDERKLSVIFITHNMGVVAHMADRIEVMYAGKIVEQGTCEEIFYRPLHPYTQALLASIPGFETAGELTFVPGNLPDMRHPPIGDAFAARNPRAMKIDFEREPPMFPVTETHTVASWLLHPDCPIESLILQNDTHT